MQDCSCYPDDESLLEGELRMQPTPGEEPYGDPERQTEEDRQAYLVDGIHEPPWLVPVCVEAVER